MTRTVRIDRLCLRVPADKVRAPERFATDVAQKLASSGIEGYRTRIDTAREKVSARSGDLARDVASAIRRSLRGGGDT